MATQFKTFRSVESIHSWMKKNRMREVKSWSDGPIHYIVVERALEDREIGGLIKFFGDRLTKNTEILWGDDLWRI